MKKDEKAVREYLRTTPAQDVAYGSIAKDQTKPARYRFLPLLGSIVVRSDRTFLALQGLLLRLHEDQQAGGMSWSIPLNERTMTQAANLLTSLGWEGRTWPNDAGWPDSDEKEAVGFNRLLTECSLEASFVFPPDPVQGSRAVFVDVASCENGIFPLAPDNEGVESNPDHLARLTELAQTPELFRVTKVSGGTTVGRIRVS